ncbi:MAG TPA: hypothetical protein VMT23_02010, partial [Candidatus Binatia bacterium]|nr:hypothetical protein [Candidatus Binatia bacterium]
GSGDGDGGGSRDRGGGGGSGDGGDHTLRIDHGTNTSPVGKVEARVTEISSSAREMWAKESARTTIRGLGEHGWTPPSGSVSTAGNPQPESRPAQGGNEPPPEPPAPPAGGTE